MMGVPLLPGLPMTAMHLLRPRREGDEDLVWDRNNLDRFLQILGLALREINALKITLGLTSFNLSTVSIETIITINQSLPDGWRWVYDQSPPSGTAVGLALETNIGGVWTEMFRMERT